MMLAPKREATLVSYETRQQNEAFIDLREEAPKHALITRDEYDALITRLAEENLRKRGGLRLKFFDAAFVPFMAFIIILAVDNRSGGMVLFMWLALSGMYFLRWAIPAAKLFLRKMRDSESHKRKREVQLFMEVERLKALNPRTLSEEIG